MNARDPTPSVSPHPHPDAASSAPPLDLDGQIEQLEQRLVAREDTLRSAARSLAARGQQAVKPTSWALPVLGGAVVLWLGWRWRRHAPAARPVNEPRRAPAAAQRAEPHAELPWAGLTGLVALGWPLLPAAWRGRVNPTTAAAVVGTGMSLLRRLLGRRSG